MLSVHRARHNVHQLLRAVILVPQAVHADAARLSQHPRIYQRRCHHDFDLRTAFPNRFRSAQPRMTVKGLHVHQDQMDSVDAAESVGLLRIAQRPRQSKASVFLKVSTK